jgi:hypothetical protein
MKAKKPFSPFDAKKRKKPLTRKALKHLYQNALQLEKENNEAIKNGDCEQF